MNVREMYLKSPNRSQIGDPESVFTIRHNDGSIKMCCLHDATLALALETLLDSEVVQEHFTQKQLDEYKGRGIHSSS